MHFSSEQRETSIILCAQEYKLIHFPKIFFEVDGTILAEQKTVYFIRFGKLLQIFLNGINKLNIFKSPIFDPLNKRLKLLIIIIFITIDKEFLGPPYFIIVRYLTNTFQCDFGCI